MFRFSAPIIRQCIKSYDPMYRQLFEFQYLTRIPNQIFRMQAKWYGKAITLLGGLIKLIGKTPPFANNIAFIIQKPDPGQKLQPWLQLENGQPRIHRSALERMYQ